MNSLSKFEIIADLYYSRYGRLAPGKSDPFLDSNDDLNWAQFKAFKENHLLEDALSHIDFLRKQFAEMVPLLDDLQNKCDELSR